MSVGTLYPSLHGRNQVEVLTKHLSQRQHQQAYSLLRAQGVRELRTNSRRHVFGTRAGTFYKTVTRDCARRLQSLYPYLNDREEGFTIAPPLQLLHQLDNEVWVARYTFINGSPCEFHDIGRVFDEYITMHQKVRHHGHLSLQGSVGAACASETVRWDAIRAVHDNRHWRDPKILKWAGVDSGTLQRSGPQLCDLAKAIVVTISHDDFAVPVHADLSVHNVIRVPSGRMIVDWDEGYWGLPGMGLHLALGDLYRMGDAAVADSETTKSAEALGISRRQLLTRNVASAVLEFASIHHSLRYMNRPTTRVSAYLAAWGCRYREVITEASSETGSGTS